MAQDDDISERWEVQKSALMEFRLGTEHDMVMQAMIPYHIGGGLDLYHYPNGLPGTAIATKELTVLPNEGPSNRVFRSYELVMFTRQEINLDHVRDAKTRFGKAHESINAILNCIARYSDQATFNPNETCEFPTGMPGVGGKCLVFDEYARHSDAEVEDFGLLLVIEIYRSEMNLARKQGGAKLLNLLKAQETYPYSDLDRNPVGKRWFF